MKVNEMYLPSVRLKAPMALFFSSESTKFSIGRISQRDENVEETKRESALVYSSYHSRETSSFNALAKVL